MPTRARLPELFRQCTGAVLAAAFMLLAMPPAAAQDTKVLHIARRAQFETLDPARVQDEASSDITRLAYSNLVQIAYLERPFKLEPDLLARMPEVSADQLTYTFELRAGVRFHDNPCFPDGKGRELTAEDVLYSIKRYADASINTKTWFLLDGAVVGLDAFHVASGKPGFDPARTEIKGFRILGPLRFSIQLTQADPRFLFKWAAAPLAVVPAEAVGFYKDRFSVNPVGSGPFTLADVDRKGVLRLRKYARYHGVYPNAGEPGDAGKGLLKNAGKRLPLVDLIEMPLVEEAQPAMLKTLKGELDWLGVDRANFTRMVERPGPGQFRLKPEFAAFLDLYHTPLLQVGFTTINMKDPLLGANKALRQAIARLFDTQAAIDVLANGRGARLNSLVPIEAPGSERDTGAQWPGYDLVEARRLLAEAGYPGGKGLPPLTIIFRSTTLDTRNAGDLAKAKFAAAGVQLKPEYLDFPTWLRANESGRFQLSDSGWVGDANAGAYYELLYSKNTAPGPNSGAFANAEYDRAFEAARLMPDGAPRVALFKTMNRIILEQMPTVLGSNPLAFGITHKWLLNFKRNVQTTELPYLDVDMALKKKGVR
jgi:oligopeptide transport system substrate-binding protein